MMSDYTYHAEYEVHEYNPDCMKIVQSKAQREVIGRVLPIMIIEVTKASLNNGRTAIYVSHVIKRGDEAYKLTGVYEDGEVFRFSTERIKLEKVDAL